ncbi:hypothetical protein OPT61_g5867 [Boeremia exigua]|uniref:Uncharacterized protein n=1 Tax=Boeremia exigua TaxID=749465 RepID=A0ACC2I8P8_9PLEO|nr:hypothetical protein OPT61_g5867 [Boeremia exigua]
MSTSRAATAFTLLRLSKHRKSLRQYSKLERNRIRLLSLQRGAREDGLVYTLHTVDLLAYDGIADSSIQGFERYEAMSYVWDDEQATLVNGNLADTLQAFRHSNLVQILWADGLCINHKGVKERAKQVKLMGLIYSMAFRVRVWLGQLAILHRTPADEQDQAYHDKVFKQAGDVTESEWTAIHCLLGRSWFHRVCQFLGTEVYFKDSGAYLSASIQLGSGKRKVSFKGLRLDTVRSVRGRPVTGYLTECLDLMALLLSDAPRMQRPSAIPIPNSLEYPYDEPFVLAFASTMTARLIRSWQRFPRPAGEFPSQHVRHFHAYYCHQSTLDISTLSEADMEDAGYFPKGVRYEASERVLFVTHDGRLGLGPPAMQDPDQI